MSHQLDMLYFEELQDRINARLTERRSPHAEEQRTRFPWLYGALGAVPSDVMFICENPSITGVKRADVQTIDGNEPDIEAQWWGGKNNPAATRFRAVLYELGLKTTPPAQRGGWNCYITNVVKEANIVKDQNALPGCDKNAQTLAWADLLCWELSKVQPRFIFAVGRKSARAVRYLQKQGLFPERRIDQIWHYSARGSHETVKEKMRGAIESAMGRHPS